MKYGKELRFMFVVAGAERSGKTFFCEKFANIYTQKKGGVIVYNPGRDDDFKDYKILNFIIPEESVDILGLSRKHDKKEVRKVLRGLSFTHFEIGGIVYHISDLNAIVHKHKKVKVFRQPGLINEGRFFKTIHDYTSGVLLLNDDFRSVARNMSDQRMASLTELYSRKNHCGKKGKWKPKNKDRVGVDIINIFHHPDKCNQEIYDYTTHIFLFNTTREIAGRTVDNYDATQAMKQARKLLSKSPRWSHARIDLKGENAYKIKIIQP